MSEPISLTLEIGGNLRANLIKGFLAALNDDCNDIIGPTTEKELRAKAGKDPIRWYAIANYGEPDSLKAFCQNHDLSYKHHCDASGEFNASLAYWIPGMKQELQSESNQDGDSLINKSSIQDLVELLLEYSRFKEKALPLFVGNENLELLIEKCLKNPTRALGYIEKEIRKFFPKPIRIPPFIIQE